MKTLQHAVVEELFPENKNFKNFLAVSVKYCTSCSTKISSISERIYKLSVNFQELISSYSKGGNDLYVDVTPETLDFVNFLIEADIAVYHRNDKTKVKLMDML